MAKIKQRKNEEYILLPQTCIKELPHLKKIRATWIANKSHGDSNSPSGRDHYVKKGVIMCDQWSGEIGFLRYYIWHIDHNYIPQKTKLKRINDDLGFSPDNCIVEKIPEKKLVKEKKPAKPKNVDILPRGEEETTLNQMDEILKIMSSFITTQKKSESNQEAKILYQFFSYYMSMTNEK